MHKDIFSEILTEKLEDFFDRPGISNVNRMDGRRLHEALRSAYWAGAGALVDAQFHDDMARLEDRGGEPKRC